MVTSLLWMLSTLVLFSTVTYIHTLHVISGFHIPIKFIRSTPYMRNIWWGKIGNFGKSWAICQNFLTNNYRYTENVRIWHMHCMTEAYSPNFSLSKFPPSKLSHVWYCDYLAQQHDRKCLETLGNACTEINSLYVALCCVMMYEIYHMHTDVHVSWFAHSYVASVIWMYYWYSTAHV